MKKLSSDNLKTELWDVLLKLKSKKISPLIANAVAKQSRAIMVVVQTEMKIRSANNEKLPSNLISSKNDAGN